MTIKDAVRSLWEIYHRAPWFRGIGTDSPYDTKIVFYIKSEKNDPKITEWEGYPVEIKIFGDFPVIGKVE
jgi:hypothetical protein